MTAPPGYGEIPGTLCVSPQKGTVGAARAGSAGCAAAVRRALAPICRFHQKVALRSLHGLRSTVPVPARRKNFLARRAGLAVSLPFIGRRGPTRHTGEWNTRRGRDGKLQHNQGAKPSLAF